MGSKARHRGLLGIENSKLDKLKEIVDATDAKIVLVSTWKSDWNQSRKKCTDSGIYLRDKFRRKGLMIYGKTEDDMSDRGHGIQKFLRENEVESYAVLDDEIFRDYEECEIFPHLVKTNFYSMDNGGLTDESVSLAVKILNDGYLSNKEYKYRRNSKDDENHR
jgi:hypothetical protein